MEQIVNPFIVCLLVIIGYVTGIITYYYIFPILKICFDFCRKYFKTILEHNLLAKKEEHGLPAAIERHDFDKKEYKDAFETLIKLAEFDSGCYSSLGPIRNKAKKGK